MPGGLTAHAEPAVRRPANDGAGHAGRAAAERARTMRGGARACVRTMRICAGAAAASARAHGVGARAMRSHCPARLCTCLGCGGCVGRCGKGLLAVLLALPAATQKQSPGQNYDAIRK